MAANNIKIKNAKSTQSFLQISEIRDDTLIMNNGTMRAILGVSSTNFDLKSQEEQDALIYNYQRFLNALEFPIQILMQSRRMNIADYTEKLKRLMDKQSNDLLRSQTAQYIEFINGMVESANVMNKSFYCVIPSAETINPSAGGFFSSILGKNKIRQVSEREKNFQKYRVLLDERVSRITSTLSSVGLRVVRLTTEQIIELVYNSYNFESGPAIDASQLDNVSLVEK